MIWKSIVMPTVKAPKTTFYNEGMLAEDKAGIPQFKLTILLSSAGILILTDKKKGYPA
jgi:hypothetical protein